MSTPPRWFTDTDDGHSQWYIERFRTMAAEGADLWPVREHGAICDEAQLPQVSPPAGPSPTPGAVDTPGTPALTPTPTPLLSDEPVLKIVPKGLRSARRSGITEVICFLERRATVRTPS